MEINHKFEIGDIVFYKERLWNGKITERMDAIKGVKIIKTEEKTEIFYEFIGKDETPKWIDERNCYRYE